MLENHLTSKRRGGGLYKKLAIHLTGHLRTFEQTHKSFFKHLVKPNQDDGFEIDIFIHTWDKLCADPKGAWHSPNGSESYSELINKSTDTQQFLKIYKPKAHLVEHLENGVYGASISRSKVHELRAKYEAKENFKYDFYLTTRPDLFFLSDLKIKFYLDLYQNNEELKHVKLPDKFMFCATSPFRLGIMDARYCNEADLLFWSNCGEIIHPFRNAIGINIFMDYLHGRHFEIFRERDKLHEQSFKPELCQEVGKVFLKRYNRRYKGGLFTFFFKDLSKILKTNLNK